QAGGQSRREKRFAPGPRSRQGPEPAGGKQGSEAFLEIQAPGPEAEQAQAEGRVQERQKNSDRDSEGRGGETRNRLSQNAYRASRDCRPQNPARRVAPKRSRAGGRGEQNLVGPARSRAMGEGTAQADG